MNNELVRYSRAGDAFHYRWAARRCLRLIDPKSSVTSITIESSREDAPGEYVIDLAEYAETKDGRRSVHYFQLKHTTVRASQAFSRSELAETLQAFAERHSALLANQADGDRDALFSFITNRPVDESLKKAIRSIGAGSEGDQRSQKYLEETTKLRGPGLQAFCAALSIVDGEGDYIVQKQRLKQQVSEYIAGFINNEEVEALIAMVADRTLPKSEDGRINGEIRREDVLQRFGMSSERDLFPAPPEFEPLVHTIKRNQHDDLVKHIVSSTAAIIVHAAGGVGKSVVARQLAECLPSGSQGYVYDCFGGGKYRNPSEPRHRASDALVQMANEMASCGLCRPLIGHARTPPDALFRAFLERLSQASATLQQVEPNALLALFVDAADNAEMAAAESGDKCFAHDLLRVTLPVGCRLIMLCRTERIALLKPPNATLSYELHPFTEAETAAHVHQAYADASTRDCIEFHRLTGGNPRVQANALVQGKTILDVLSHLSPGERTVSGQIAAQLKSAVNAVKDKHVDQLQIDDICRGLANLPPFVPLEVLAAAARVDVSTVRSFVSDLGRPLWHTDDAVQFRDEPTETWFREQFGASKDQIAGYLAALEPVARNHTYVSKVIPQLLLKSENYERLVTLALSDDLLPENNPIDQRDIRLYRLQFALKAALRLHRYADAARLAFRAGEEAAGSERQLSLLQSHLHLIALLQGPHRVQELAYCRAFTSGWEGSQNLFSGSLLSAVKDFHGEARTYLRASERWLHLYFDERARHRKDDDKRHLRRELLDDADIAELGWSRLNLAGPEPAVKFLTGWTPAEVTFRASRLVVKRLVDEARFEEIDQIARLGAKNVYLTLAIADELLAVARFPPKSALRHSLDVLTNKGKRIPKTKDFAATEDRIIPAILSLAEASTAQGLSRKKIQSVIEFLLRNGCRVVSRKRFARRLTANVPKGSCPPSNSQREA